MNLAAKIGKAIDSKSIWHFYTSSKQMSYTACWIQTKKKPFARKGFYHLISV
jgi:hypothetical protein